MSRILPVDPVQSLKAFEVRPGFHVELVAAEPLLRSPVAIDFDEDGRLYVAEFPEYNQYADHEARTAKAASGCWRTPTATASTTRARSSPTTCRWRPPSPAGTAASTSGRAPDLLYLKDTDGDGKADVRRVVFTGFGTDRGRRGDAQLVPLGAGQPLPHLDQHSTAARSAAATSRRRRRSRSAARTSSSTRAARRSS